MELTKEEAISEHRKMWDWIADETENKKRKIKKDEYFYFNETKIDDIPINMCYCCEFSRKNPGHCTCDCIINWGEDKGCINSYFTKWILCDFYDWEEAARLSRIIANLPEREVSD